MVMPCGVCCYPKAHDMKRDLLSGNRDMKKREIWIGEKNVRSNSYHSITVCALPRVQSLLFQFHRRHKIKKEDLLGSLLLYRLSYGILFVFQIKTISTQCVLIWIKTGTKGNVVAAPQ